MEKQSPLFLTVGEVFVWKKGARTLTHTHIHNTIPSFCLPGPSRTLPGLYHEFAMKNLKILYLIKKHKKALS